MIGMQLGKQEKKMHLLVTPFDINNAVILPQQKAIVQKITLH